ncbi:MAG: hypothetical protein ACE5E7_07245 [Anaerolineae bacterium]
MMRRLLIAVSALAIFFVIIGASVTYSLALNTPHLPGDPLYPAQLASEQFWGLALNLNKADRAGVRLNLLARRLDDLEAVQGTSNELAALNYFDDALNDVVLEIGVAPETEQPVLQERLTALTEQGLALLGQLEVARTTSQETALSVLILRAKLETLLNIVDDPAGTPDQIAEVATVDTKLAALSKSNPGALASLPSDNALDSPRAVPFPSGAVVAHSFFPLTGGHANVSCSTCHSGGTYSGIDKACIACHATDDVHNGANGTSCEGCHNINDWKDAAFDHSTIGSTDCAECHSKDAPPNHYAGACRDCHSDTTNFKNVHFSHANINADCGACHRAPENHYTGACRDCHSDTTNFKNAHFSHASITEDCGACHRAPENHYTGSCRSCHTDTTNFRNANFSHQGLEDCQSCHARPAGHYSGQCSDCHTTASFHGATFNHTFPINHKGANGQCSICHPGGNTESYTCFNCHNQQKTIDKHAKEGISNIADCAACHANGSEHGEGGREGGEHEDGGGEHENKGDDHEDGGGEHEDGGEEHDDD